MRTLPEGVVGLRWLLLSAMGAGACGGNVDAIPRDGGGGATNEPTAGTPSFSGEAGRAVGGAGGATTITAGTAGNATTPSGGSMTGGSGGAGGGGTVMPPGECASPQVVSGFVTCGDGLIHREAKVACESTLPQTPVSCGVEPNLYMCDGSKLERCGTLGGGVPPAISCDKACLTDADCEAGQVCFCGPGAGTCIAATCTEDADCDSGYFCRQVQTEHGYGCGIGYTFQCQRADDACRTAADCGEQQRCQPAGLGEPLRCEPIAGAACGRPYLVHGTPRLASPSHASGWSAPIELEVEPVDAAIRREVADGWQALGLMEHASIAAFARFTLQLLSLGAPRDLVVESNRAIADETRHAELCFGLAAAFGSRAPAPGALDSRGALDRLSLREVALDTFLEGCVGETIAALEASEGATTAGPTSVRQVLTEIAEDESRHASLAWRFVAWAVEQSPELLLELRAMLASLIAQTEQPPLAPLVESPLSAFGLLDEGARTRLRRMALREVVAPCLTALEERASSVAARADFAVGTC